ncbi:amidohydrolase family protein [Catalinimonas niigatensis]|uniref:amidohydrolase family protein n=1 Tax=Catalinimonas niigatensis TaxID=1397264 RepID=UPI002666A353|nr:amidohydrolase family protein [Catalinimonas niigatensis]WPP51469.1 amidohydrolase family protein [Catalinimonas niigatensis]
MLKRRSFVKNLAAASALTSLPGYGLTKHINLLHLTEKNVMQNTEVIEWNAHIFSPDTQKFPFHSKASYQPDVSGQPADPLGAYLQRLDEEGIDRAVIVHPEPYGDDHALILDCLQREPDRLRGTSLFYPKDTEAPRKLAALVKQESRIIATRFHAHRGKESYLDSFADAGVRALWKQALELDLVVELHIGPNYARQAGEVLQLFPDTKVLIDHLAEPHMGTAVEFAEVLELAKYPNVYMKLSGLNHFAEDEPLYESALPFTARVIKEFGPDRMVWGSGSPQIVDAHMQKYSKADIAKVKGENLSKLLDW